MTLVTWMTMRMDCPILLTLNPLITMLSTRMRLLRTLQILLNLSCWIPILRTQNLKTPLLPMILPGKRFWQGAQIDIVKLSRKVKVFWRSICHLLMMEIWKIIRSMIVELVVGYMTMTTCIFPCHKRRIHNPSKVLTASTGL